MNEPGESLREAMVRAGVLQPIAGGHLVPMHAAPTPDAAPATISDADWNKLSPSARLSAAMKARD